MSDLSNKIDIMKNIVLNEDGSGIDNVLIEFYRALDENADLLEEAYELDKKYSLRKEPLKMKLLLDNIEENINYKFNGSKIFENIDEKRVMNVKQGIGVIGVFYDGDILITIDILSKALRTNNAVIFNLDISKNIGTNNLIVNLMKDILKRNNKLHMMVDINFADNDNLAVENLDAIIVTGSKQKRTNFRKMVNCKVIESGFGYNEIYVEDLTNESFIKEIIEKEDSNIKFFIKEGLETSLDGVRVNDLTHAINLINEMGAGYSAAIFTNDQKNAREFIRKVKCRYAFFNASPTIANISDIDIDEFFYEKCCIV